MDASNTNSIFTCVLEYSFEPGQKNWVPEGVRPRGVRDL